MFDSLERAPALVSMVTSQDRDDPVPNSLFISLADRGNDPLHNVRSRRSWDLTYTQPTQGVWQYECERVWQYVCE